MKTMTDHDYSAIKDLIETHTKHLTERADRSDARMEKRLDGIDLQLSELCITGCAKGIRQDERLKALEEKPAKIGAIIVGTCAVLSTVIPFLWVVILHFKRYGI
jgi:hypothetical protein